MGRLLFLLFLVVPLLEIYILIQVGGVIGALPTVAAVVGTALLGAILVRTQGLITLQRAQAAIDRGEPPALELLEGVVLLVAGALLLTPGFFTDALGFLCLVPSLRRKALQRLALRVLSHGHGPPGQGPGGGPRVIEGEYRRED
jgi:UPF0716 protein FxsA